MQNETLAGIVEGISGFFDAAWGCIELVWDKVTGFFSDIWTGIHENETLGKLADTLAAPFQAAWTTIDSVESSHRILH
jgi:hypothetical protein